MGFSDIISNFISEALFLKGYSCAHTLHLQLLSPENKDNLLIIAISRSGKTSRLVELVEEANTHGFKIISFTANKNSKLAKASTLSVPIGSYDSFKSISEEFNTFFGELLLIFKIISFTANKNSKLAKASTLSVPIGSYDSFKSISEEFNTFFGELLLIFEYLTN